MNGGEPMTVSRSALAAALSAAVVATFLVAPPALAAPTEESWPLTREKSTPGTNAVTQKLPPDPAEQRALRGRPVVTWPTPGTAFIDIGTGRATASSMPVSVARAPTKDGALDPRVQDLSNPSRVRVDVLDAATADRADISGVLLRVGRADAVAASGTVSVRVDYAALRHAYGGDWGNRLRLVTVPDCALVTPGAACRGTVLPTVNDPATATVTADVPVPAAPTGAAITGAASGTLVAVAAGASGTAGSFAATELSAS